MKLRNIATVLSFASLVAGFGGSLLDSKIQDQKMVDEINKRCAKMEEEILFKMQNSNK